ncbi:hypothetical protein MMC30_006607 [Trapelia coarctata]|nr:hypothetical protein [Trapelia coarctata]
MGKKRKAGGKPSGEAIRRDVDPSDAKLRISIYEDVADSEDEFHLNRDKVLLDDGPDRKRQRRQEEEDAFLQPSDEEVLADVSDEDEEGYSASDEDLDQTKPLASLGKWPRGGRAESEASEPAAEDEVKEGWGTSKKDYYNADLIETEADALEEEQEAIRLQKKQLQGMTEADFGFDEAAWLDEGQGGAEGNDEEQDGVLREVLPQLVITDAMGSEERTKMMSTRYPEFEPLAREFLRLRSVHEELMTKPGSPAVFVKIRALTAYLAALSMYFALFTSGVDANGQPIAKPSSELRDHPIMKTLMQCRELWEKCNDQEVLDLLEDPVPAASMDRIHRPEVQKAISDIIHHAELPTKKKKSRKSKAQRDAEIALADAYARRAERLRRTEENLAKLSTLKFPAKKTSKASDSQQSGRLPAADDDSDFGEETALTAHEAEEKAKRKKTLRFYTSQIDQKSNKRDTAGRDAGGDADLPYRERFKDRQARLNSEAEAKGKKRPNSAGDALGGESDDEDGRAAKEIRGDASDEDYYDLVAARSQKKKSEKAALAAAYELAAREGGLVRIVEEVQEDGKRAITYAIEKNKGLTPKRKKDVRNPRVKKRKKYEDKKKKLSSVRQVYKGGEGRGGYGGELTGIKKRLVRSVKL